MPNFAYNSNAEEIVTYVHMEPLVRRPDYEMTVKAEVHDALWMLTQQWRVNEFKGEDAGTVVKAKIETQSTLLNRFKGRGAPVEPMPRNVPIEAKVERLPVPLDFGFGLEIAYQWLRILRGHGLTNYDQVFAIEYPIDTALTDRPDQRSNVRAMQIRKALAGRLMDGAAFWNFLQSGGLASSTDGIANSDVTVVNNAEADLKSWFSRVYYQPANPQENFWAERQLEYQFALSAPLTSATNSNQTVFRADRYQLGTVDWYSVDIDRDPTAKLIEAPANSISNAVVDAPYVDSYLPSNITFKGMPKGRWWEFEDRNIDLARMMMHKQDIVKMLVLEFGIIYSNDWFVFPHKIKSGSVSQVNGLVTTDVFGRKFLVKRAGSGLDDAWQRWDMYNVNKQGVTTDSTYDKLLLMPALMTRQEGEPTEKVLFLRDDMANMVWGVEEVVPDELMAGRSGKNAADELMDHLLQGFVQTIPGGYVANDAKLRYKIATSVPENWIPFIAAKGVSTDRKTVLQRATFPRYLDDNYTPDLIRPRTELLSVGLPSSPYYINEEEVSRSGFVVSASYARTRWYNGQAFTWLGRKVQSGRGEGASGLKFDFLQDKEADDSLALPLSGAAAWWRADDPQNVLIGSDFQLLYDRSESGNHISAFSASTRPALLANWQNNNPALAFNGGQALRLPSLNLPTNTSDFTVFMVGEKTSSAVSVLLELSDDTNSSPYGGWAFINNEYNLDHMALRQAAGYNVHGIPQNITLNTKGVYVLSANLSDANPETSVEFNDQLHTQPIYQADNTGSFPDMPFNIGSRANQIAPSRFNLAELIVYPTKLTTAQREVVKNYLKQKYAL